MLPCTFDGFGFTVIIVALAVTLGQVKSIVSGVEAVLPWWGRMILTVHDSDANDFIFILFLCIHTHTHTHTHTILSCNRVDDDEVL